MPHKRARFPLRNAGRALVIGACLMASMALVVPTASALHGDNPSALTERDNNLQTVERINVADAGNVACGWGFARLDNTEVNTQWPGNSDIRCRDGNYNKRWLGFTICVDRTITLRCDIFNLRFDWDYGRIVNNAHERRWYRYIGCHEFGHTSSVGHRLGDRDHNSCMKNGHGHIWFDKHDHTAIRRDY